MSDKQYDYDSAAVRREARKFRDCCETLEGRALPKVRSIRGQLEGNFIGKAANALDRCLDDAETQIKALRNNCNSMYRALNSYADALEKADDEIARSMGGR